MICKAGLLNKNGAGLIYYNSSNNIIRLLTSFTFSGTCSNILYRKSRHRVEITLVSNFQSINRRMVSTKQKHKSASEVPTVKMGSILEHPKYKELKSELSKRTRKGFNLGPLNTALPLHPLLLLLLLLLLLSTWRFSDWMLSQLKVIVVLRVKVMQRFKR